MMLRQECCNAIITSLGLYVEIVIDYDSAAISIGEAMRPLVVSRCYSNYDCDLRRCLLGYNALAL